MPTLSVQAQLDEITDLDRAALVERWRSIYGRPPPKGASRRLLERAAAYAIQAKAYGGLKPRIRRQLLQIADPQQSKPVKTTPGLAPGTRLVREWNGRTHQVDVTETGFVWNGDRYGSLSAVARAITGARWSGPRFFGL